ncbi:hypothetical protein D3C76_1513040 [compost metagenome]
MGQQQRQRIVPRALFDQDMDNLSVNLHQTLLKSIDARFPGPPVKIPGPELHQAL